MLELLKEIILDFQELPLPVGGPRRLSIQPVTGKATVVVGVRRSGKSTFMFQLMQQLVQAGVSRQNILYLNFFDDRLHGLRHDNLAWVTDAYFSLYPEKKHAEQVYCFFDEIQVVRGWEPFVDRLMRTETCAVYITGSSAHMLSKELATQMRGRALSWEMFPFSFQEFLDHRGLESALPWSSKKRLLIQKAFEAYWETGGFPEVAGLERNIRMKIHQEYFTAVLFRDVVERYDIPHPRAVADLAHWLVDNTGSLYSINALTGYLKSLGHKASKSAVADYLNWLEDAYAFFTVRLFDASLARAHANPKKIYCVDHALVRSLNSGILVNSGHLLENLVFVALRRVMPDIFYYRTQGGREVDFVLGRSGTSRRFVQVCESLANPQTRKRELLALSEAMRENPGSSAIIVTRNESEHLTGDFGSIEVLPVWQFLLDPLAGL